MKKQPFFSIFIPTKNRHQHIEEVMQSILHQNYYDFELIISNNGANSETRDIVNRYIHDKRVQYIEHPQILGMPQHWEIVTKNLNGNYIIIVTDRFLLKQNTLRFLHTTITSSDKDMNVITWPWSMYYPKKKELFESIKTYEREPSIEDITEIDSYQELKNMASGTMNKYPFILPRGLNSCVKSNFMDNLREKHRIIFRNINPDHTFGYLCLHNTKKIYHINYPLSISLGIEDSNGHKSYHGNAESYLKEIGIKEPFLNVPLKLAFVINSIHEDFLSIAKLSRNDEIIKKWNKSAYYKECLVELDAKKTAQILSKEKLNELEKEIFLTIKKEKWSIKAIITIFLIKNRIRLIIKRISQENKRSQYISCKNSLTAAKISTVDYKP